MITFAAQFDGFRISKVGDRILQLRSYDGYAEELSKVTNGKMGQEFIVLMIPTNDTKAIEEFKNETPEQTKSRFSRQMNAMISEIAKLSGKTKDEYRNSVKQHLIDNGIIKKSTTELDVEGYAFVITKLKEKRYELRKLQTPGDGGNTDN